ncbi:MAG: HD domain-containing protein [Candidatus Methanomethylicia archaeon]
MVEVSQTLIKRYLNNGKILKAWNMLERSIEIQTLLKMSNIMAVKRLKYNDHGPVHSRITSGAALEILKIISKHRTPNVILDHGMNMEDAQLTILLGAYLHDIGNCIHRIQHPQNGCYIIEKPLNKILRNIYDRLEDRVKIKCEVLHCIYSSDDEIQCLSLEAGIVKVADGLDMAEGRARIPYDLGKKDIHSLSALAIKRVEIEEGNIKPLKIKVVMENPAGIFQIQNVLMKKISTSGLRDLIEITAININGEIFMEEK